jgi:septation ring formation regulator EzrA
MTRMKKTSDEIQSFVAKFDAVKEEIEENNKRFGSLKMEVESKKLQM